jgi:hypothetical protein
MRPALCTATATLIALQLAGCATAPDGERSRAGQGAMIGAAVGALLGAATGDNRKSVLAGAALGAAVGAAIGHYQDRQVASRAEAARRVALANEPRLEVDSHVATPQRVRPGAAVESQVGYTVLAPGHAQDMKVSESRALVRGGESFPLGKRELARPQGSHVSTLRFTLPADLPAGDYQLVTTIASGTLTRTVQTPLSVG